MKIMQMKKTVTQVYITIVKVSKVGINNKLIYFNLTD